MKIYYISKIEDNVCYLETASGLYSETVAIEDIRNFAKENTVVGYNFLTGSLSVETEDSVYNYIDTKRKLTGKPLVKRKSKGKGCVTYHKIPDRENTILVTTKDCEYDVASITSILEVDGNEIVAIIENFDDIEKEHLKVTIEYDLEPVNKLRSDRIFDRFPTIDHAVDVDMTIQSSRTDTFENVLEVRNILTPKLNTLLTLSTKVLEMSNCKFNPECRIYNAMGNIIANYMKALENMHMHESFYEAKHEALGQFYGDNINHSDTEDFIEFLKVLTKTFKNELNFTVAQHSEIKYSDLLEMHRNNPKLSMEIYSLDNLVLDSMIEVAPDVVQPFEENHSIVKPDSIVITDDFDIGLDYDTVMTLMPLVDLCVDIQKGNRTGKVGKIGKCNIKVKNTEMLSKNFSSIERKIKGNEELLEQIRKAQAILKDKNSEYYAYARCFSGITADFKIVFEVSEDNLIKLKFLLFMLAGLGTRFSYIDVEIKEVE